MERETAQAEIALIPLLTAEASRNTMRRQVHDLRIERDVMKDKEDWIVGKSFYNTANYVPKSYYLRKDADFDDDY